MMREKVSKRLGRRSEENWRERLPKKWERERGRAELESLNVRKENREKRRKREEHRKIERVRVRGCETTRKRESANVRALRR